MEEAADQYVDVVAEYPHPSCCPPSSSTGLPCQLQSCNSCTSTPFVSAPSSPRTPPPFAYFLARATLTSPSPPPSLHNLADYDAVSAYSATASTSPSSPSLSDFDFCSRFSQADAWLNPYSVAPPMSTAEELFHNGKIRPLNTRLCSATSYCLCFGNAVLDDGYPDPHFDNACTPHAYTDGPPSPHADLEQLHRPHHHHLQQQPLMKDHIEPTSTLSALEQWKRSMGRYDKGCSRHAHGHNVETVMQRPSLPLAHYRNSRHEYGHHRRARSLSPLRVFHMDEKMNIMQGRSSVEREMQTNSTVHAVDGGTIMRPRRSRKSWTLKELLYMGDNRVHDKRPKLQAGNGSRQSAEYWAELGSKSALKGRMNQEIESSFKSAKSNVAKRSLEEETLRYRKGSRDNEGGARLPWNLQQAVQEEHADPCYSIGCEEGQAELEMKKNNFLHYKKGLLGCLGFTAKLNSMKLHAMSN